MSKSLKYMHQKRFGGLREEVLERDGYRCVTCGMTRAVHRDLFGCDLTLHHKDGCGRNKQYPNNTLENLETLCLRCHGAKDAWRTGKYSKYAVSMNMAIQNIHNNFPTAGEVARVGLPHKV